LDYQTHQPAVETITAMARGENGDAGLGRRGAVEAGGTGGGRVRGRAGGGC